MFGEAYFENLITHINKNGKNFTGVIHLCIYQTSVHEEKMEEQESREERGEMGE